MPSITRRPPRGPGHRAAAEAQVFAAVERLLNEGMKYTEISVQRIISEAEIARSTFYAHFRDKSDLLSRLAEGTRENFFDAASAWEAMGAAAGVSSLTQIFEELIARHREHSAVLLAITEIAAYDQVVRDFYTSDLDAFEARVVSDLKERQQAGLTAPDLDPAAASRIIVWGGEQAIAHHISTDDGSGDATFARELATIWWYGAYCRQPVDPAPSRPFPDQASTPPPT